MARWPAKVCPYSEVAESRSKTDKGPVLLSFGESWVPLGSWGDFCGAPKAFLSLSGFYWLCGGAIFLGADLRISHTALSPPRRCGFCPPPPMLRRLLWISRSALRSLLLYSLSVTVDTASRATREIREHSSLTRLRSLVTESPAPGVIRTLHTSQGT